MNMKMPTKPSDNPRRLQLVCERHAMPRAGYRSGAGTNGFTLVELVAVIVITGIMAAALMVFFKPTIEAYFDVKRRAGLADMADTALRRMGRDVRLAVPNSIRSPGNQCFELLPTIAGGRYRMARDTVNDSPSDCTTSLASATCSAPLDPSQTTEFLDVLSISPAPPPALAGGHLVIGNQNTNDVYAAVDNHTRSTIQAASSPNTNFGSYRLQIAATQFAEGYDGGRFSIVAANSGFPSVFYVCSGADGTLDAQGNGKGSLFRVNAALNAGYPTQCPNTAGAAIVASRVRSCNFIYSPTAGRTQQSGFVWMQLELAEANESVSLSYGVHVDNVP